LLPRAPWARIKKTAGGIRPSGPSVHPRNRDPIGPPAGRRNVTLFLTEQGRPFARVRGRSTAPRGWVADTPKRSTESLREPGDIGEDRWDGKTPIAPVARIFLERTNQQVPEQSGAAGGRPDNAAHLWRLHVGQLPEGEMDSRLPRPGLPLDRDRGLEWRYADACLPRLESGGPGSNRCSGRRTGPGPVQRHHPASGRGLGPDP